MIDKFKITPKNISQQVELYKKYLKENQNTLKVNQTEWKNINVDNFDLNHNTYTPKINDNNKSPDIGLWYASIDKFTGYIRGITLRTLNDCSINKNHAETYSYEYDLIGKPMYLKTSNVYREAMVVASIILGVVREYSNLNEIVELSTKRVNFSRYLSNNGIITAYN